MSQLMIGGRRNAPQGAESPVDSPQRPLVSVVTVVWNGVATLEQCIQSVLRQTYRNVEHIIIDGGSTDGTLDLLRQYDDRLAYWSSGPDAGIYDALNKGIRLVNGRYYIPLGCDDLLTPEAAAAFAGHLDGADVVFGQVRFQKPGKPPALIRNHSAGVAISVEAHRKFGFYDTSYRIAADTKFLNQARLGGRVRSIDDVVGCFIAGGASGNYRLNIREHARAMRESGAWTGLRAFAWLAPRLVRATLRGR